MAKFDFDVLINRIAPIMPYQPIVPTARPASCGWTPTRLTSSPNTRTEPDP